MEREVRRLKNLRINNLPLAELNWNVKVYEEVERKMLTWVKVETKEYAMGRKGIQEISTRDEENSAKDTTTKSIYWREPMERNGEVEVTRLKMKLVL
ncbi:hypothetical protein Tco_1320104 [Tanacetum coccineum]